MPYYEKIKNEKLKKAVLSALSYYGYKLHFLPSSITGRYHPEDERGIGGLELHVEKMCWLLERIAEELAYDDYTRDVFYTAAYFHDLGKVKQTTVTHTLVYEGSKTKRATTVERRVDGPDIHPLISAKIAEEYLSKEGVDSETIQLISNLIKKHMSHWYSHLPKPSTELEKMFALADYLVSRTDIVIKWRESVWKRMKRKLRILH